MRKEFMRICSNKEIARNIYEMVLEGEITTEIERPGQFLHIKTSEQMTPLLRRPLSICDYNKGSGRLTIIYRAEGAGTKLLAAKRVGDSANVLGPLGNGFITENVSEGETIVLAGGGIGVPPLYGLGAELKRKGVDIVSFLGYSDASVTFYQEKFKELGDLYTCTIDGSEGHQGLITDVMKEENIHFDRLFACGPVPMLKALEKSYPEAKGSLSLEERMGCGIGACFACVCHVQNDPHGNEYRKVCSDGPVFPWREVVL